MTITDIAARLGELSGPEVKVLVYLAAYGKAPLRTIATKLNMSKNTVALCLKSLESQTNVLSQPEGQNPILSQPEGQGLSQPEGQNPILSQPEGQGLSQPEGQNPILSQPEGQKPKGSRSRRKEDYTEFIKPGETLERESAREAESDGPAMRQTRQTSDWDTDETFLPLIEAYREAGATPGGSPVSAADWSDAWLTWKTLDMGTKLDAVRGVILRANGGQEPRYFQKPRRYLDNGEFAYQPTPKRGQNSIDKQITTRRIFDAMYGEV